MRPQTTVLHRPLVRGERLAAIALSAAICLAALGVAAPPAAASSEGSEPGFAGKTLTEALLELAARGLKIVFTSSVVTPDLVVEREPAATEPRRILDELLAPHGLAARDGPNETLVVVPAEEPAAASPGAIAGSVRSRRDAAPLAGARVRVLETGDEATSGPDGSFTLADPGAGTYTLEARAEGFLPERLAEVTVRRGERLEVAMALDPIPHFEEEMEVTPSRVSLLREEPAATIGFSRDDILALPHLGDDFYRAISLLPGVLANDVSAQFHVRGGRRDETQILIDGQELYEAFHLKDFDSALSFVAPATLGSADLTTGGFSVQYGDRMSGVLDMTTVTPTGKPRFRIGAGILGGGVGGAGAFHDDRGNWVAEVRRGAIDLVGQLVGGEDPVYWDAFAKLAYRLGPHHSLRANALHSGDEFELQEVVGVESKVLETEYNSTYAWLTYQTIVNSSLYFETAGSMARIDRDRRGVEQEEDVQFTIRDARDLDVLGLRQDWYLQATPGHRLNWGWQVRDFDSHYDYFTRRNFDNPLARIRHDFGEEPEREFLGRFEERHSSVHAADRFRPTERLTLELGLRFDRHALSDESHLSPRGNLAFALGERSVLRAAWGRFNQSQRPYELQVEDGETGFYPVERAEHRVLGFERLFGGGAERPSYVLRVEVYQREVGNPRTRYENLFEPINNFPELEPDRVRVEPQRSLAEGIEIFLRGRQGPKLGWWINYTLASTEDRIGGAWVPRIFDQTHSVNVDFDYRFAKNWRVNLAWRYHTGWPTTAVTVAALPGEEGEVEFVPVLGPINGRRLPTYHRLDLRASRRWQLRSMTVDFFIEAQNAYDRQNIAGFDLEIDEDDGSLVRMAEGWPGFIPSAGVTLEF